MDRPLVVNASPLILLACIDRLDLLASLAKILVVPEAVIREIQAGSDRDGAQEHAARQRGETFERYTYATASPSSSLLFPAGNT